MAFDRKLLTAFKDKKVLVTGHTGFKGSWLSEWLLFLGAQVIGISLPPKTNPSLFEKIKLKNRINHNIFDIRERSKLKECVLDEEPDYIFHLAAQPIVRKSYLNPIETYSTNFMGSVYLLDVLREMKTIYQKKNKICSSVFITSDKCYENNEWLNSYREEDPLGGYDPYSSSKAAAEIAIAAYRNSFFTLKDKNELQTIGISSARAGNVIGGGDWSEDRIVPDCINSLKNQNSIKIRYPNSTRPWQHVLDALSGYLKLAYKQRNAIEKNDPIKIDLLCTAFNFGPTIQSNKKVKDLVEGIFHFWPGKWEDKSLENNLKEASLLNLSWEKAYHILNWEPIWDFEETIKKTVNWYKLENTMKYNSQSLIMSDINSYMSSLKDYKS